MGDDRLESLAGSSPLARGLPSPPAARMSTGRIIPARAGFTRGPPPSRSRGPDHPRSRGVYGGQERLGAAEGRIIPARAGFTSRDTVSRGIFRDHPRSRGVYTIWPHRKPMPPGSSPLARGLPGWDGQDGGDAGIIPARAGFTRSRCRPSTGLGDHPRSRGVYPHSSSAASGRRGSSPLARGLRVIHGDIRIAVGIIPARAGFTHLGGDRLVEAGDHPRSRGVYVADLGGGLGGGGIIPARAGFTRAPSATRAPARDHPRSRGVYTRRPHGGDRRRGSSPLARGLHRSAMARASAAGIIPARAGFTSWI